MRALAAVLFLAASTAIAAPVPPKLRLGDAAAPRGYELRFEIDPRTERFAAEARIEVDIKRAARVLWLNATALDFDAIEVTQDGRPLAVEAVTAHEEYLGLAASRGGFRPGRAVLHFRYRGALDPVATRGLFRQKEGEDWYVVSQFEAISARRAFPSFDEPGWKTPFQVTVDAPEGATVASNTPLAQVRDAPGRAGWRRHEFTRTKPLPTYLVALAVGPFDVVDGGSAGRAKTALRYFVPRGRAGEARFARESTPRILELLEEYFGSAYPFEKLDSVTIPAAIGFGAMENAGMITYSGDIMLARPHEESTRFLSRYVGFAAHEIAHHWFGNLVTPAWWDDIWLNEAFATWLGRKIAESYNPEWEQGWDAQWTRRRAIAADRLSSARRVRNPVIARDDIFGGFDHITYNKGGEVLSMFEALYGEERFRQGVRDFLARHAWGSATSGDFFRAIAQAAGRGPAGAASFESFVDQPGVPLVDVSLRCEGGKPMLRASQRRFVAKGSSAPPAKWSTPACFMHGAADTPPVLMSKAITCVEVTEQPRDFPLESAQGCPDWLVGNARGVGHWIARYDAALASRNRRYLWHVREDEAMALVHDASILEGAGHMATDHALATASAALEHSSPSVFQGGVFLLQRLRDDWLTVDQHQSRQRLMARHVLARARALGWTERGDDTERVRQLRVALLPYAARYDDSDEGDLRAAARAFALEWISSPHSVAASMVQPVLDTASRFADQATFERLHAALHAKTRRSERSQLVTALGKVRDPALRERALSLVLQARPAEGALNPPEALALLHSALADDANRPDVFAWVRKHWDAVVKAVPPHTPASLIEDMAGLCTARERDAFAAFFRKRAEAFRGGPKAYRESLEAIRICVAVRGADGQHGREARRPGVVTKKP